MTKYTSFVDRSASSSASSSSWLRSLRDLQPPAPGDVGAAGEGPAQTDSSGSIAPEGSGILVCGRCGPNSLREDVAIEVQTSEGREPCVDSGPKDIQPEAFAAPFCDFLTHNPTVFHTVRYFEERLDAAGFEALSPRADWKGVVRPGGKYYVTRNGSSLVAFAVGEAYKPGNGVAIVAGHIDALTARLKPVSTKPTKAGYVQLGVAPYAGGLNETWWDRDLSVGGRVFVRDEATGKTSTRLVKLDWPSR